MTAHGTAGIENTYLTPPTPSINDLAESAVARWVQQQIADQPWYKRKANTITTLGGALATVLTFVMTNVAGAPDWVVWACSAGLLVLTVLGVNVTKNGTTETTGTDLQRAVNDPLVLRMLVAQAVSAFGGGGSLQAVVERAWGDFSSDDPYVGKRRAEE